MCAVVALLGAAAAGAAGPYLEGRGIGGGQPSHWVEGELLVGFRAGVDAPGRDALYRKHGAGFLADVGGQTRIVRLRVPAGAEDAMARRLERMPAVKFVEKNFEFTPALAPNDPEYINQWHLPHIKADLAWDLTQGSASAVIAILDSGIDPFQPDFDGKLLAGYNTFDNTTDTSDAYGHGTEVAGVAGALTNNAAGVAGVAGNAPLMPVRVANATGGATSASIANGIIWATDHGARVINLSFEGVVGNTTIATAAEYAYNHGTLVVAASGNCGCVDAQAESPFILSVSATDETDALASFSSTGAYVDVSAPGTNILTTAKFSLYLSDSGTSLASPVVAGVAGLMFAANPALTPAVATQLLESSAVDLGTAGYDPGFGFGRVDALAAVNAAIAYVPPPDTLPPAVVLTAPASGATVSGTVVVDAAASDNVGVVQVKLLVDGVQYATDASSPYSFAWDASTVTNGAHTLEAVATDAAGNSGTTGPMGVTVANATPHAPVANDDAYGVAFRPSAQHPAQLLAVLANDSDADGDMLASSVHVTQAPDQRGTASVNADGTISYTPRLGFRGTETLRYTVNDARGATSNAAIVTVTVNGMAPRHGSDRGDRNMRRLATRP